MVELRVECLELAIATSAGVAAVPSTPATSPAVTAATFGCGIIVAVATALVSTISATGAALASTIPAAPTAFAAVLPGRTPGRGIVRPAPVSVPGSGPAVPTVVVSLTTAPAAAAPVEAAVSVIPVAGTPGAFPTASSCCLSPVACRRDFLD